LKRDNKLFYDYEIPEAVTSLVGTSLVHNENSTAETCVKVGNGDYCL